MIDWKGVADDPRIKKVDLALDTPQNKKVLQAWINMLYKRIEDEIIKRHGGKNGSTDSETGRD